MEFRIADTFTDSLRYLTNDEQKQVKTTVFDLQINPSGNGSSFHRIERSKDTNFWSVRASSDLRIIVHKTEKNLLICYVAHHDKAYDWARRRKLEVHPKTGAAQLVEIQEIVRQIPAYISANPTEKPLFEHVSDDNLIKYGIPVESVPMVRAVQNEEDLFKLTKHLPQEACEILLELATGNTPAFPEKISTDVNPFNHPDALRHFRIINNQNELEQAFAAPWEKWIVFLHPAQRTLIEKEYSGPARVSGSAGTGKTVVALHRAVSLAKKNIGSRILLTTFTKQLANALSVRLRWLLKGAPKIGEQIEIQPLKNYALNFYRARLGQKPNIVSDEDLKNIIACASKKIGKHNFAPAFVLSEWNEIVDARWLKTWEEYRDVVRLGRKTRLPEQQREVLWQIFTLVKQELSNRNLMTISEVFEKNFTLLNQTKTSPIDFAVIDEAQDLSIPELKFLSALGKNRPDSLFFSGDIGQRIFQTPFSWKQLGISIQGRSSTLKINYRTSHQIRLQADRLLPNEISDVDGNIETRTGTISIFDGPTPKIQLFKTKEDEIFAVSSKITEWIKCGIQQNEIGIFVRSDTELEQAKKAIELSGEKCDCIDDFMDPKEGCIIIGTMHQAKGLEFKAVIVMSCDEDVIPSLERIENVTEESDLSEVYNTERYLLYVACTRARDALFITGVFPGSEFIEDMIER